MGTYHCTWEIDIEADSHENAARKAKHYQRKLETTADVFDVHDENGNLDKIDLTEIDEEQGLDQSPVTAEMFDWRRFDPSANLTGNDLKSWPVKVTKNGATSLDITLTAPDGTTRSVWLEIEAGDLRVRVYPDEAIGDDPAGELRLKPGADTAEAVFER